MAVNISALDRMMPSAVRHFWRARVRAAKSQATRGSADQGNRSGVTAGNARSSARAAACWAPTSSPRPPSRRRAIRRPACGPTRS